MAKQKNHLSLYLSRYAEDQIKTVFPLLPEGLQFDYCLVIPAYNETIDFLERIKQSPLSQTSLLLILVVNQPDNQASAIENQQLWMTAKQMGLIHAEQEHGYLTQWQNTQTFMLALNQFTNDRRLPLKQGVGLARKIGCDIACALIEKNIIRHHWIHTTDADTHLPNDYFARTPDNKENYSAAIYPFQHSPAPEEQDDIYQATLLYEQSLVYYLDGLNYAKSIYAYHALGSCIAINAIYYAQARGFPKRAGGEDFYLLNKLRKLGNIKILTGQKLSITARLSNRAPFGTGPSVRKIMEQRLTGENYHYYNPLAFRELKLLLENFEHLFQQKDRPDNWLNTLSEATQNALATLGIHTLFTHIKKQASSHDDCIKQCRDWLDAFRTLKFLHLLESRFPKIPLQMAIVKLSELIDQEKQTRP